MKTILKYLKPFYGRMSLGLLIKASGTLVELALPYILSHILKNVVGRQDVRLIVFWGGVMIACAALACVCNICANRMAANVARNFSERIRRDPVQKNDAAFGGADGRLHNSLSGIPNHNGYL